jgi:hypothetical protein
VRFELHGDFEAEDLDDAFARLAAYFALLAAGEEPSVDLLGIPREMKLEPAERDV